MEYRPLFPILLLSSSTFSVSRERDFRNTDSPSAPESSTHRRLEPRRPRLRVCSSGNLLSSNRNSKFCVYVGEMSRVRLRRYADTGSSCNEPSLILTWRRLSSFSTYKHDDQVCIFSCRGVDVQQTDTYMMKGHIPSDKCSQDTVSVKSRKCTRASHPVVSEVRTVGPGNGGMLQGHRHSGRAIGANTDG